jgi:hypothetical protein
MTVDSHAPSMVAAPSGTAAACPASMHPQRDRARMAAEGSTATTLMPYQLARAVAQLPVPDPHAGPRRQVTGDRGPPFAEPVRRKLSGSLEGRGRGRGVVVADAGHAPA